MNRIKQMRNLLGYTQSSLAKHLGVSRSAVAMWETSSQSPDYEMLRKMADLFHISQDYIMGRGIFSNWDLVIKYYDDVAYELIHMIPSNFVMPSFCKGKFLIAWLDTRLYQDFDELELARWFSFAVKKIDIEPMEENSYGEARAEVSVEFTPEFDALISASQRNVSTKSGGYRIPVLGAVPAGIPLEAIEDIIDWEEIPASMLTGGREYFGLVVKGDSMYPEYLPGDTVIVRKSPVCNSGDVCVVYVNGYDATLKKVKLGDDQSITLIPRNPEYPPRTYTRKEIENLPVSIAGVVVELRRKVNK